MMNVITVSVHSYKSICWWMTANRIYLQSSAWCASHFDRFAQVVCIAVAAIFARTINWCNCIACDCVWAGIWIDWQARLFGMWGSLLTFYDFSIRIFLICAATAAVVSATATAVFHYIFCVFIVVCARIQATAWRELFVAGVRRCRWRIRIGTVSTWIFVDSRRLWRSNFVIVMIVVVCGASTVQWWRTIKPIRHTRRCVQCLRLMLWSRQINLPKQRK